MKEAGARDSKGKDRIIRKERMCEREIMELLKRRANETVDCLVSALKDSLVAKLLSVYKSELNSLEVSAQELTLHNRIHGERQTLNESQQELELSRNIQALKRRITRQPWEIHLQQRMLSNIFRIKKHKQHLEITLTNPLPAQSAANTTPTADFNIDAAGYELRQAVGLSGKRVRKLFHGDRLKVLQNEEQIATFCASLELQSTAVTTLVLQSQVMLAAHNLFLAHLAHSKTLLHLDLSRCKLGTMAACKVLGIIGQHKGGSLETLNLSLNKIVFGKASVLPLVQTIAKLQELNLSKNVIEPEIVGPLTPALTSAWQLRVFNITHTGLNTASLNYLLQAARTHSHSLKVIT